MKLQRLFAITIQTIILLSGTSCKKDASDIWVMAVPITSVIFPANPDDSETIDAKGFWTDTDVFFNIEAESIHGPLTLLEGTVSDPINGSRIFIQKELSERSVKSQIAYHTPATDTALKQVFTFKVIDAQGYTGQYSTNVYVYPSYQSILTEQSSITLRCGSADDHNAYSFSTRQTLSYQSSIAEDASVESIADIILESSGESLKMTSATNVIFVRNPAFDYSSATDSGVKQVFSNSITSDFVPGLEADDVILVGRTTDEEAAMAIGVLKISVKEDNRIMFNLKHCK